MSIKNNSSTHSIEFVFNGNIVRIDDPEPQMSALVYCREQLLKTGTHEGCAEGDCGACTVVIAELDSADNIVYKNVNACILLLPMLQGKALFTVESLQQQEKLHPVQQAMIDYHASQCGFCTPGFVMSLYSLYQSKEIPTRDNVSACLSGNLCRCTGYNAIYNAALHMHDYDSATHHKQQQDHLKKQLLQLKTSNFKSISIKDNTSFMPKDVNQLCELKDKYPKALIVAGNTDVGLWINKQLKEIEMMIHLSQIDELKHIVENENAVRISAAVSVNDAFKVLVKHYPSLADLARRFASQPICNAATLVGNLANGSPIGDSAPILMALGATLNLKSVKGDRVIELDNFYLGYQHKDLQLNEFVESVSIPINTNTMVACYKISKRFDQDITAVTMAFVVSLNEANEVELCNIVCGGMAATTAHAFKTEQALSGQVWQQSSIDNAKTMLSDDFQPLDDLRASADYRMQLAENLLQRFYIQTTQQSVATSVYQLKVAG